MAVDQATLSKVAQKLRRHSLESTSQAGSGHPTPRSPWVRVATGSLGQGLSAAAGMAWARKADGDQGRVYVLLGDGEVAEGAVWEAAAFASHHGITAEAIVAAVRGLQ